MKPETRSVMSFFLLTCAITWSLQFPPVLMKAGVLPGNHEAFMVLVVLGVFGPTVSAVWLLRRAPAERKLLFQSLYSRPPGLGWMAAALATSGALLSLGLVVTSFFASVGPLAYPILVSRIAPAVLISLVEEIGWRGYALPRLSMSIGRLKASLIIGAVWTVWHIPMLMGQQVPLSLMPVMLVHLSAGSIVFSWFYFRTGGSLLIAVLLHLGAHLNNSHLALPGNVIPLYVHAGGWLLLAVAVLTFDRRLWKSEPSRTTITP